MYSPILKEIRKDSPMTAISDIEENLLVMHEELSRVLGELYEMKDEWEGRNDSA